MSQQFRYPNSAVVSANFDSEGTPGAAAPSEAIQVAGSDGANLRVLSVSAAGVLNVAMSVPPTGAATSANQVLEIAQLTAISGQLPATLGQKAMAASLAVAIASNQSAIPVSMAAAPTGAALETTQLDNRTYLNSIDGKTPSLVVGRVPVDGSGVTQPVSGTFWQATQPVSGTFWQATQPVSAASLPLPTGAATETTLAAQSAKLPATLGQKTMANSMAVAIASDQSNINVVPQVPAALTVKSAGISVGTSAVRLTTDGAAPSSTRRVLMANCSSTATAKFYIGSSGVTASNGVQLVAGQTFCADEDAGDYYIISDTVAQTIFVTEQE